MVHYYVVGFLNSSNSKYLPQKAIQDECIDVLDSAANDILEMNTLFFATNWDTFFEGDPIEFITNILPITAELSLSLPEAKDCIDRYYKYVVHYSAYLNIALFLLKQLFTQDTSVGARSL